MKKGIFKKQKLLFGFAASLILSLSFLASVSAQSKLITKDEFETVKENAAQKLRNISYSSFTSEIIGKNETKTIYEFVPPNREHFIVNGYVISITSKKTNSDNPLESTFETTVIPTYNEWIYTGEKIYYRNGANKKWEETAPDSIGKIIRGTGDGTFSDKPTVTTEYKLTPNQFVLGQETDLYEVIISRKYSWKSEPSIETYKYWINKNGLFAKTQHSGITEVTTVDYLYSLNIEIKAPLIKKRNKSRK